MKIVEIFPGKVWGGAEQYILELGTSLAALGHEVRYVVRNSPAVTERLNGLIQYTQAPLGGFLDFTSAHLLSEIVKDADVVHLHELKQAIHVVRACRLAGCKPKIVVTRHIARASRVLPWQRQYVRQVDYIIFVSRLAHDLWVSVNGWYAPSKTLVIHNCIAPYKGRNNEDLRLKYNIPPEIPILMYTGRVRKSKGCELILHALAANKDLPWAMIFVGSCKPADYNERLRHIAEKHGISNRVFFHGFSSDARGLVRQADLGLAPSIVREAWGLAPMEFMEASKCVIVSDNGAQREFIYNNLTGMIVRSGDVDSLAGVIRKMLINPETRVRIGRNAGEFIASSMSYPNFLKQVLSAFIN